MLLKCLVILNRQEFPANDFFEMPPLRFYRDDERAWEKDSRRMGALYQSGENSIKIERNSGDDGQSFFAVLATANGVQLTQECVEDDQVIGRDSGQLLQEKMVAWITDQIGLARTSSEISTAAHFEESDRVIAEKLLWITGADQSFNASLAQSRLLFTPMLQWTQPLNLHFYFACARAPHKSLNWNFCKETARLLSVDITIESSGYCFYTQGAAPSFTDVSVLGKVGLSETRSFCITVDTFNNLRLGPESRSLSVNDIENRDLTSLILEGAKLSRRIGRGDLSPVDAWFEARKIDIQRKTPRMLTPEEFEDFASLSDISELKSAMDALLQSGRPFEELRSSLPALCRVYCDKTKTGDFFHFCQKIQAVFESDDLPNTLDGQTWQCYVDLIAQVPSQSRYARQDKAFFTNQLRRSLIDDKPFLPSLGSQQEITVQVNGEPVVLFGRPDTPGSAYNLYRLKRRFLVNDTEQKTAFAVDEGVLSKRFIDDSGRSAPVCYEFYCHGVMTHTIVEKPENAEKDDFFEKEFDRIAQVMQRDLALEQPEDARRLLALITMEQFMNTAEGVFSRLQFLSAFNFPQPMGAGVMFSALNRSFKNRDRYSIRKTLSKQPTGELSLALEQRARLYMRLQEESPSIALPFADVTVKANYVIVKNNNEYELVAGEFASIGIETDHPELTKLFLTGFRIFLNSESSSRDREQCIAREGHAIQKALAEYKSNKLNKLKQSCTAVPVNTRQLKEQAESYLKGMEGKEPDQWVVVCKKIIEVMSWEGRVGADVSKSCQAAAAAADILQGDCLSHMLDGLFIEFMPPTELAPLPTASEGKAKSIGGELVTLSRPTKMIFLASVNEESLTAWLARQIRLVSLEKSADLNEDIDEIAQRMVDASSARLAELEANCLEELRGDYQCGALALRPQFDYDLIREFDCTCDEKGNLTCVVDLYLQANVRYAHTNTTQKLVIQHQWKQMFPLHGPCQLSQVQSLESNNWGAKKALLSLEQAKQEFVQSMRQQVFKEMHQEQPDYKKVRNLCQTFLDAGITDVFLTTCQAAVRMIDYLSGDHGKHKKSLYESALASLFNKTNNANEQTDVLSDDSLVQYQSTCKLQLSTNAKAMQAKRNEPWQIAIVVILWFFALVPGVIATILFHCLQWSRKSLADKTATDVKQFLPEPPQPPVEAGFAPGRST